MTLTAINLTPRIGTEIKIDLETMLNSSAAAEIRGLLAERGILAFRAINLDDEQQLAFSATIGRVLPQGGKGIFKITLDKNENAPDSPSPARVAHPPHV